MTLLPTPDLPKSSVLGALNELTAGQVARLDQDGPRDALLVERLQGLGGRQVGGTSEAVGEQAPHSVP